MGADPMQSVVAPLIERRSAIWTEMAELSNELSQIESRIAQWYALPDPESEPSPGVAHG